MKVVLEALLVVVMVWLSVSALAALAGLAWLHRRNRVAPGARAKRPLRWLISPTGPSRAHRRLRRAVTASRVAVTHARQRGALGVDHLEGCVAELQHHALAVDDRLAIADRCPPRERRAMMRGLAAQVAEVERLSARLVGALMARGGPAVADPIDDTPRRLTERLDALDAAHAELAALEADWIGRLPGLTGSAGLTGPVGVTGPATMAGPAGVTAPRSSGRVDGPDRALRALR